MEANDSILQTPNTKVENKNELAAANTTSQQETASPPKRVLNVDPLPAAAVEEQPAKEEEPTL